jgi:predicted neuraminidase
MMRQLAAAAAAIVTLGVASAGPQSPPASGGDLRIERVFGPEVPTGRYKHPASITELRGGDLYLVYYGGAGEYATETAVFGARLKKGASAWTAPKPIARDPFRSLGNAVVWEAPDGVVWLFYVVRFGDTWSTSRIQAKISRDGAETWSDAFMITTDPRSKAGNDEGLMVRNRPIVLTTGEYLLPIYHETGHDTEMVGPDSTSLFLRFNPQTRAWTMSAPVRSPKGNIQPAVVQLSDTHLVAYCRRGGGYGPTTDGYIIRAESHDGGMTWSEGRNSAFANPNSAVEFLKLESGALLLVYNDSMTQRTPLTAALSLDGDRTYAYRRNIAEGSNSFAYPFGFQAADGLVHVVYTSDNRTVINHAVFGEEWVKGAPRRPSAGGRLERE